MNELDRFEYVNELYEIYKNLLTDKQIFIMNKYYIYNLSLSEISEELDVSRNAISDTINTVKKKLKKYEDELHLLKKFNRIKEILDGTELDEETRKKIIEVLYYGI